MNEIDSGVNVNGNETEIKPILIELEDIQDKIDLWNSSIICYVVGSNPPIQVVQGFLHRIWRNFKVNKGTLG